MYSYVVLFVFFSDSESESESEEENDDHSVDTREEPQSHRRHHEPEPEESSSLARIEGEGAEGGVDNHQVQDAARPKPNFRARLLTQPTRTRVTVDETEVVLGSLANRKSRKR